MIVIGAFEAKNTLSALLDRVEKGEEITITRRGKPVAKLTGTGHDPARREAAIKAAADLLEMSKGVTLGGISIRELIDDGRR